MRSRPLLLAACLLTAVPAPGAGLFGGPTEPGQVPSRFIKVDVLDVGEFVPFSDWPALSAHLASVTCVLNRVRFGVAAVDMYAAIDFWSCKAILPVHVGYTIWSNPKRTSPVWSSVPDLHFDVTGILMETTRRGYPETIRLLPTAQAALCCDVSYCGVGASLQVGGWTGPALGYETSRAFFAELRLRALTFGIGF
jgi:hypothetical protein